METTTVITLDLLNINSVSVISELQTELNGKVYTLEKNRRTYVNSPLGRAAVIADLPDEYMAAIFALWGDAATIEDPPKPEEIN